jgi:hypothetical protein
MWKQLAAARAAKPSPTPAIGIHGAGMRGSSGGADVGLRSVEEEEASRSPYGLRASILPPHAIPCAHIGAATAAAVREAKRAKREGRRKDGKDMATIHGDKTARCKSRSLAIVRVGSSHDSNSRSMILRRRFSGKDGKGPSKYKNVGGVLQK